MYRRYTQPLRSQFDTEEEYQEELNAWDAEMQRREQYLVERSIERRYNN